MKCLDGGQFDFLLLFSKVNLTLIVQVPLLVSLRCLSCFRYLDISARWFKTYRFRGWKWYLSHLVFLFLVPLTSKFKMDARVQDVTEGTSYTMMVLHLYVDVWALYLQPSVSYEWSSFSVGNVGYRRGFEESEMMNLFGCGSLGWVE